MPFPRGPIRIAALAAVPLVLAATGCTDDESTAGRGDAGRRPAEEAGAPDAAIDADASEARDADASLEAAVDAGGDATPPLDFCALPGSIVFDAAASHVVPGGDAAAPDLSWVKLPPGFCVHHFAVVPVARAIRFAPGGELFVTSPTATTTGGGQDGLAAIVALADDDADGVADAPITFASGLASTQGIAFAPGWLYWQDGTRIVRVAYQPGDRSPGGAPELVADVNQYVSYVHWPKSIDVADDGTIYVGNGGDQGEACDESRPFRGGVVKLDGSAHGAPVVRGLRNPIALRCQRGRSACYATELSRDYSAAIGGREKLIPLRAGDDWGYPCCASANLPYPDVTPTPDCSGVVAEDNSFVIGNTPFGFDFEPGLFPAPWKRSVFVALHGEFGTWYGAQLVAIATDPATGAPLPSSNLDGGASGAMQPFATGWDDGSKTHGRPADATFAEDGRLFVADDVLGEIFWIAPALGAPLDGGAGDASADGTTADGGGEAGADAGAGSDAAPDVDLGCASAYVSFSHDVQKVFDAECTGCHDGSTHPSGQLSLVGGKSWASVVGQPALYCAGRTLVTPGEPSKSWLYSLVERVDTCTIGEGMPPDARILAEEIETIRNWICLGAKDD